MSQFSELLAMVIDFKKSTDKLLVGLNYFEKNFSNRESELSTLSNQILVLRTQKETMEAEAKLIISNAERDAKKIMDSTAGTTQAAHDVMMQAAKDREESKSMMDAAKSERKQLDFDKMDLERQLSALRDKQARLQEALK